MSFETISYETIDGIALITLNRPGRLNAINSVMSRELPSVWDKFRTDPSAHVAIVTGAGHKAFCSGADVDDLPAMITDEQGDALPESVRWTALQNDIWKPVICALNGPVMGGGLHFVAESDVVFATMGAQFSDPHVSVGLVSALETIALARRAPIGTVLRMALAGRGEVIEAERAYALGFVDELCVETELIDQAFTLARKMCRNSPSAMARTKQAIWSAKQKGLRDATQDAWALMNAQNRSADFEEGILAFRERRLPKWAPLGHDQKGAT